VHGPAFHNGLSLCPQRISCGQYALFARIVNPEHIRCMWESSPQACMGCPYRAQGRQIPAHMPKGISPASNWITSHAVI
jgi:hypothetical protein